MLQTGRLLSPLIMVMMFLQSCAPIARRRPIHQANRESKVSEFNPIKKKIALLTFYNESPMGGEDLAIVATEEFRREVSKSREFIIDPEGESIFGNSKEIYAGGGVKLVQLARKAKMSGVNIVVFGRIKEARVRQKSDEIGFVRKVKSLAETYVELKAYDVLSNKELFTETVDGNISDDNLKFYQAENEDNVAYRQELLRYSVKVAVRKLVPKVVKVGSRLDWMGRVAKIIGTRIYLNAGRNSGLNLGDIMKVITEGQEIYDPESGAMIGMSQGEVKGTLEVVDYFGTDGAICILHSGGSVTEGDFVQLY
jgi:curli biogenesis system outer membrane secretion channel CsgG